MKKIFALVATASLLFSCSQEVAPEFEKLPINLSVGQQTRANDSTFENEDEVGIYVVNYDGSTAGTLAASGNQADNERFTYNNGAWTPDETIYWKDQSTAADFYAYYPYSESVNISAHPFSVMSDQSTEDNFWASDFLWGKATNVTPTSAAVPIVTNHSLSRIIVNVKPGNGFTEESWAAAAKSVKVCDVVTSATIDLSTGTATATGDKGEIIPLSTDGVYKAMLVPQEVADNSKLVVVTVDGVDYVYRKGYTFKRNTQHTFTITVNKKGGNVDVTIGEWEMDDFVNIGNAEEEEATIPNNQIWYTATAKVELSAYADFGATVESNEWDSNTGEGIITFDGDITSISSAAFQYCNALTSITIPNSVTSILNYAFNGCGNLVNVILPNNISAINDYTFQDCSKLENITIPENVSSIGKYAFNNCHTLSSINIPAKVTTIGSSAFTRLNALQGVYITDIEAWCKIEFTYDRNPLVTGKKLYLNGELVTELNIPEGIESISAYAFYNCTSIESLIIPSSVQSIGSNAFFGTTSLTTVYCTATTPPTLAGSALGVPASTPITKVYVPADLVTVYKNKWTAFDECIVAL